MIGLVLSGGGGRGGYQIGVWKALIEKNIEIAGITGTSVGALNGALILSGSLDKAITLWMNLHTEQVVALGNQVDSDLLLKPSFDPHALSAIVAQIEYVLQNRGLDVTPLQELIAASICEEAIRKSSLYFGLVTYSLTDKKPLELSLDDIPTGKLKDYLLASAFLPVFAPLELDGKYFLDGAVHDNLPINLLADQGLTHILAVDIRGIGIKRRPRHKHLNVLTLTPSEPQGHILAFDGKRSARDVQMGYLDARRLFGDFAGQSYFITPFPRELDILHYMNRLLETPGVFDGLCKSLQISMPITPRILFERMWPILRQLYDGDTGMGYDALLALPLEFLAEQYAVERLQIYTFEGFLQALRDAQTRTQLALYAKSEEPSPMDRIRDAGKLLRLQYTKEEVALELLALLETHPLPATQTRFPSRWFPRETAD